MYENHFYKVDWKELDRAGRSGIKNKERRKIWEIPQECMGEVRSFNSKKEN